MEELIAALFDWAFVWEAPANNWEAAWNFARFFVGASSVLLASKLAVFWLSGGTRRMSHQEAKVHWYQAGFEDGRMCRPRSYRREGPFRGVYDEGWDDGATSRS